MTTTSPPGADLPGIDAARELVRSAVARRVAPAAVVECGSSRGPIWREAFGTLSFESEAVPARETDVFDLASLTKPVATATIALTLEARGTLALDARVAGFFAEWRGDDREAATVRDLLEHASGLPARLVDPPPASRREFEHDICTVQLAHAPRAAATYSDLGFILLGFIAEDVGGDTLARQFERVWRTVSAAPELSFAGDEVLTFGLPSGLRPNAAPTLPMDTDPRRGRSLAGEVHDDYAAALGGVAGHSGLFGNAAGVGLFARALLRSARGDETLPPPFAPGVLARAVTRSTVPGSSRALGWDTMLPSSSCGTRMSVSAFGHVGFTGTSLWIDPERDRYFVLLTNRACGGGTLEDIRALRRAFHDSLGDL